MGVGASSAADGATVNWHASPDAQRVAGSEVVERQDDLWNRWDVKRVSISAEATQWREEECIWARDVLRNAASGNCHQLLRVLTERAGKDEEEAVGGEVFLLMSRCSFQVCDQVCSHANDQAGGNLCLSGRSYGLYGVDGVDSGWRR